MKIALYISPRHTVPSRDDQQSVPWDVTKRLADGLSADGTDSILLFAARNSKSRASLHDFGIDAVDRSRESLSPSDYHEAIRLSEEQLFSGMASACVKEKVDIVHILDPAESLTESIAMHALTMPIIITVHDAITTQRLEGLQKLSGIPGVYLIATSAAQHKGFNLPFYDSIMNGIDVDSLPFNKAGGSSFVMAGRVAPEKGFEDAIKAVSNTGGSLTIAGKIYQNLLTEDSYFRRHLAPRIAENPSVTMREFLQRDALYALYGSSKAFLYPILWDEPFGVSIIEAMACGTPVIAYNRGFIPEVIVDGVTGFIIEPEEQTEKTGKKIVAKGIAGLREAMERINEIDRSVCREYAQKYFDSSTMILKYKTIYKKLYREI